MQEIEHDPLKLLIFLQILVAGTPEQVRQSMYSWSYFRQRRDDRRSVVDAHKHVIAARDPERYLREWPNDDTDYSQSLGELVQRLRPDDACTCPSLYDKRWSSSMPESSSSSSSSST